MTNNNESIDFPIEVFPDKIQKIILDLEEHLNYPIEFTAASMFFAASVAIGNSYRLKLKIDHIQSPIIYLALVGNSGVGKTHPLHFAMKPLELLDKNNRIKYKERKKEYDKINALTKKKRKEQNIELPPKPIKIETLLSDLTLEAINKKHSNNLRGLGIYSHKLKTWLSRFERYVKGGEEQYWIKNWRGATVTVNRRGKDPVRIKNPFISIAGGIQQSELRKLFNSGTANNSFLYRFLFANKENLIKQKSNRNPVPYRLYDEWERIINNLLSNSHLGSDRNLEIVKPTILKYDDDAREHVRNYRNSMADRFNECDDKNIRPIYSKIEIYQLTFSLILELLHHACKGTEVESVTLQSAQGSIKTAEYFTKTEIRISEISNNCTNLSVFNLPKNKIDLYDSLPEQFALKHGVEIAEEFDMSKSTFRRFAADKNIFKRIAHGIYAKI